MPKIKPLVVAAVLCAFAAASFAYPPHGHPAKHHKPVHKHHPKHHVKHHPAHHGHPVHHAR